MAKTELPLVHEEVKAALRARLQHDWPAGQRLPPIKQLARELGAGQNNTHRAVKELVAEGLLMSRPRRGTFVSQLSKADQRGTVASVIRGKRVLVLRGNREPFLDIVIARLTDALQSGGGQVRVELCDRTEPERRGEGDALVLVNASGLSPMRWPRDLPAVVVDTALETAIGMPDGYDIVSVDGEQGGHLAGQWFAQIGLREVGFVGVQVHGMFDQTSGQRLRGFQSGLGRAVEPRHIIPASNYMTSAGALAFAQYLAMPQRPQGVFCASDDLAVGFVHGGLAHGMEPGRDFQVIGFDGQTRGRELQWPLTTVDAPMARMGEVAAELILQRLADPAQPVRRVYLGCTLFRGATTR